MRTRPTIITAMALAGALLAASSPVQADVVTEDVTYTLYDSCRDYGVPLDASMPGATDWQIDVDLFAPSGDWSSGVFDYGDGDGFSGEMPFTICADEGVGAYVYEGTLTWYDADYNEITEDVSGTLRMVRQRTRSAIRVSDATPRYNSRVTFRMRSQQEAPSGWASNAYEYVALEFKCGFNSWSRLRGSKSLTDAYGRAAISYRWDLRRTCKFRTVTLSTVNSAVSRSLPVTVNPH